jgi:tetrahydromethanopterin S-methyltransferase subunit G
LEDVNLVQEKKPSVAEQDQALDIERVKKRLDMLDHRLDNIDSMVTAVAERVMKQPLTINIICPHCGRDIEIAVLGNEKPRR